MSKCVPYEVYICYYNNEIVYIGEGALNRHQHCTSGASHVYELNELHFLGDRSLFKVDVKYFDSKEKASQHEVELIKKLKPKFNKKGNGVSSIVERKEFKQLILQQLNTIRKTQKQQDKLKACVDEFLIFHTHYMLREEGILFRSFHDYKKCGLNQLYSVVNNLKTKECSEKTVPYMLKHALETAYKYFYKKDANLRFK